MSLESLKPTIPKIIHLIVLGSKTSVLTDRCMQSWLALKPLGYEIRIWNGDTIAKFLLEFHEFAYEAFINARNLAEASDIARYLIVYTHGGIYADWDIELLKVEQFLDLNSKYNSGYLLCDPANETLASEHFCALKSDEYLLNLTMEIVSLYKNGIRNSLSTPQYSGPFRMRDCLRNWPSTSMVSIPVKEAFAFVYTEIRNPPKDVVTQPLIHYWIHSWLQ